MAQTPGIAAIMVNPSQENRRMSKKDYWAVAVFPSDSEVKRDVGSMQEMWVPSLDQEEPLEEGIATCSSILV